METDEKDKTGHTHTQANRYLKSTKSWLSLVGDAKMKRMRTCLHGTYNSRWTVTNALWMTKFQKRGYRWHEPQERLPRGGCLCKPHYTHPFSFEKRAWKRTLLKEKGHFSSWSGIRRWWGGESAWGKHPSSRLLFSLFLWKWGVIYCCLEGILPASVAVRPFPSKLPLHKEGYCFQ